MSAPAPFAVMLANASTHGRPITNVRNRTAMGAGIRQHDEGLDGRAAAYLRAGLKAGHEDEYRVVAEMQALSQQMDSVLHAAADCNVILARINGRMEKLWHDIGDPRDPDNAR